jgi:hypothetical protein
MLAVHSLHDIDRPWLVTKHWKHWYMLLQLPCCLDCLDDTILSFVMPAEVRSMHMLTQVLDKIRYQRLTKVSVWWFMGCTYMYMYMYIYNGDIDCRYASWTSASGSTGLI